jgi:hypothetical protein
MTTIFIGFPPFSMTGDPKGFDEGAGYIRACSEIVEQAERRVNHSALRHRAGGSGTGASFPFPLAPAEVG